MSQRLPHDTSISDINLFLDEPLAWFLKRYMGYKQEVGPRAHLGTSVEYGLAGILLSRSFNNSESFPFSPGPQNDTKVPAEDLLTYGSLKAQQRFRELTQGEITDDIEAEYGKIVPCLSLAAEALAQMGELVSYQRRIEPVLAGLRVLGFVDFTFRDRLVDLKVTGAVPSEARAGHVRQVALYAHATGLAPSLVYVSHKKKATFEVDSGEAEEAMYHVGLALRAIARIKRSRLDWRDMAELYPPRDLYSFRYDQDSRALIRSVLG